jgi:hypothetical protein
MDVTRMERVMWTRVEDVLPVEDSVVTRRMADARSRSVG